MESLPSQDARELYCYATSNSVPYNRHLLPAYQLLERKWRKGTFDRELAIKLLVAHTLTAIGKDYVKDFCFAEPASRWNVLFPPAIRRETAAQLLEELTNELELGNSYLPAKR